MRVEVWMPPELTQQVREREAQARGWAMAGASEPGCVGIHEAANWLPTRIPSPTAASRAAWPCAGRAKPG